MQLIAEKAGLKVEFTQGPTWSDLLRKLRSGNIDVIPAIYATDKRRHYAAFTSGYFSQPSVIVVKHSNHDINDFSDLSGKRIAGVRDFAISDMLERDYPDIHLKTYASVTDCLKAVAIGDVDAYIDSIGLVAFSLDNNFVPNLRVIGDVKLPGLSNPPLHMGVIKGNDILLSILNKGLASVTEQEKQRLSKKWLTLSEYEKRLIFTSEQARWIRQHPTIKVGLDPNYPPYSFVTKNGKYAGIIVDFLTLLGQKTGIEFTIVPGLQWQDMLNGIKNKSLDMGAPIVQTVERNEHMIFSPPFIAAPLVIMTRSDNNDIRSAGDLYGKKIALVKGYSSSARVARENPGVVKQWVETPLEGLQAVSTGHADAFIGVVGVNIYLSQQHGINNLQVSGTYDLNFDGQRFAIRSDWSQLAVLIDKALDSITPAQRNEIHNRWIQIPDTRRIDYRLLWQVVVICFVIVVIMYLYIRRLLQEIRQRKRAEQNLIHGLQQLDIARRAADKASRDKSRFVSNVSHELKTPLNAIIGLSDILRLDAAIAEESHKQIELIFDAGQHLNRLIDDLLDLSRIEAGKMQLDIQAVDPCEAIDDAITLTRITATARGISINNRLQEHPPGRILADPTRLKQVLLNLLSNAIKYNVDSGSIELNCATNEKDMVQIEVRDSGIGIDPQQLEHLFDYFERGGAEYTSIQGTGIGLALSKHLVEAMEGEIGVRSCRGEGSTFWFTLKAAPR